jgi:hypothetical protein
MSVGTGLWAVVGSAVLLLAATAVIVSIPDIKRYIKIRAM